MLYLGLSIGLVVGIIGTLIFLMFWVPTVKIYPR